jgi:hypothetical protein
MRGWLPWAAVVAGVGGLTWWLLANGMAVGRWLFAALLVGHGLVHLLFLVPVPRTGGAGAGSGTGSPRWPFDLGRSWVVTRLGSTAGPVRAVALPLIAVTIGAFVLAGLATVEILVPVSGWPLLVAVGAVASLALLVLAFDLQLVLGLGLDACLLWIVASGIWRP